MRGPLALARVQARLGRPVYLAWLRAGHLTLKHDSVSGESLEGSEATRRGGLGRLISATTFVSGLKHKFLLSADKGYEQRWVYSSAVCG